MNRFYIEKMYFRLSLLKAIILQLCAGQTQLRITN